MRLNSWRTIKPNSRNTQRNEAQKSLMLSTWEWRDWRGESSRRRGSRPAAYLNTRRPHDRNTSRNSPRRRRRLITAVHFWNRNIIKFTFSQQIHLNSADSSDIQSVNVAVVVRLRPLEEEDRSEKVECFLSLPRPESGRGPANVSSQSLSRRPIADSGFSEMLEELSECVVL